MRCVCARESALAASEGTARAREVEGREEEGGEAARWQPVRQLWLLKEEAFSALRHEGLSLLPAPHPNHSDSHPLIRSDAGPLTLSPSHPPTN